MMKNKKKYQYWSRKETNLLTKLYPCVKLDTLLKRLPKRNKETIVVKALSLNLYSAKLWHPKENHILRNYFEKSSKDKLLYLLSKRSWKAILAKGERLGLKRETAKPKLKVDENYFEKWTPNMAYILGFIIADGCIIQGTYKGYSDSLKLGVHVKDRDILEKIKSQLKAAHAISIVKNAAYLSISSQIMINCLKNLGVTYRKSLNENVPQIPLKNIRHFIRGVVDGDGSIWQDRKDYPTLSIAGGENILSFIRDHFFDKFRLYSTLTKQSYSKKVKNYLYQISYRANSAKILINYLYKEAAIYLDRKYYLAHKCLKANIKTRQNSKYILKRYHETHNS